MQTLQSQFLAEVESFLARSGINPTAFGQQSLRDPRFVFDLRRGRACSSKTIDKVRAFIREAEPATGAAA